jgi:hypothetical protein
MAQEICGFFCWLFVSSEYLIGPSLDQTSIARLSRGVQQLIIRAVKELDNIVVVETPIKVSITKTDFWNTELCTQGSALKLQIPSSRSG